MKILIIEDEPPIADEIYDYCHELMGAEAEKIYILNTYYEAVNFLQKHSIDLCLLDLNLKGKNGYDILKQTVASPFHTIIVSAHTEQAIDAFNYGVLDFVPKPVSKKRLKIAIDKFMGKIKSNELKTKYLLVRKKNSNFIVSVSEVIYFKASGYLVEIHLNNGKIEIYDKSLNRLGQILPENFVRVHRSFIVDINQIKSYKHKGSGVYELSLMNGEAIPLSNNYYKLLKKVFEGRFHT